MNLTNLSLLMVPALAFLAAKGVAEEGSVQEKGWHRLTDDMANGRPFLSEGNNSAHPDSDIKAAHEALIKSLGHDIEFVFDWKSYKIEEWVGQEIGAGRRTKEYTAASVCTGGRDGILEALVSVATDKGFADYKSALTKIKTITCHSKSCEDLPRSTDIPGDATAGYEYKLSRDKTNIDVSSCASYLKMGSGDEQHGIHALKFLKQKL